MDSVNMTTETNAGMGGFIGSAATNTNSQGMTTITANVDPIQSKVNKYLLTELRMSMQFMEHIRF